MNNTAISFLKSIQVLLSFFMAMFSMVISGYIVDQVYIQIEGDYLEPFGGRPDIYYFWESLLTGVFFVVVSYILLRKIMRKTLITATMFFIFNILYSRNIMVDVFYLNYVIIMSGITAIGIYEAVKRKCF